MLVLRSNGPRRFAHLERELPPISAEVLAQRLRELERDGFVARRGRQRPAEANRRLPHRAPDSAGARPRAAQPPP